jgi:hypothetical protein
MVAFGKVKLAGAQNLFRPKLSIGFFCVDWFSLTTTSGFPFSAWE